MARPELPEELTELVEQSAAPTPVRVALERLIETRGDHGDRIADDHDLARATVSVMAASRSLTRSIEAHPDDALGVLGDLGTRPVLDLSDPGSLV